MAEKHGFEGYKSLALNKSKCVGSYYDSSSLITMYCSLVRSNLKYCPLVSMNNRLKQNHIIESVQKKSYFLFLKSLLYMIYLFMVHMNPF